MSEPNVSLLLCLGLGGVSGEGTLRFNIQTHTHEIYSWKLQCDRDREDTWRGATGGSLSRFDGDGGGTRTRGNMCTAPTKPGTLLTLGVVCGLRV